NQDGAFTELARLLVVGEALGVDVDLVELGEPGLAAVELVGGQGRADVHPLAIADGLLEFAVGGKLDQRRLGLALCGGGRYRRPGQQVGQYCDHPHRRDARGHARSVRSNHGATSSLSESEVLESSWRTPVRDGATLRRTSYRSNAVLRLGQRGEGLRTGRWNCKRDANERIPLTNPCRALNQRGLRRPYGARCSGC